MAESRADKIRLLKLLQEKQNRQKPTGALEAGVEGAAQGLSLGFADEIEAGLKAAFGEDDYQTHLEKVRARLHKAQKDQPAAFTAGELGGGLASTFVPGLGIARGAKPLVAGLKAAGLGGAQRVGAAEDLESLPEAGAEFAKGAALSGALAAPGQVTRAIGRKMAPTASEMAGHLGNLAEKAQAKISARDKKGLGGRFIDFISRPGQKQQLGSGNILSTIKDFAAEETVGKLGPRLVKGAASTLKSAAEKEGFINKMQRALTSARPAVAVSAVLNSIEKEENDSNSR